MHPILQQASVVVDRQVVYINEGAISNFSGGISCRWVYNQAAQPGLISLQACNATCLLCPQAHVSSGTHSQWHKGSYQLRA